MLGMAFADVMALTFVSILVFRHTILMCGNLTTAETLLRPGYIKALYGHKSPYWWICGSYKAEAPPHIRAQTQSPWAWVRTVARRIRWFWTGDDWAEAQTFALAPPSY